MPTYRTITKTPPNIHRKRSISVPKAIAHELLPNQIVLLAVRTFSEAELTQLITDSLPENLIDTATPITAKPIIPVTSDSDSTHS